jgi:hypothetical protein
MANWANPTITSNYITFVDEVKARDVDAITLQAAALTAPPVSSIKLVRSPVKFQEWNGTVFNDLVLSPAGGGTGVTSIAALTPLLGLGSMAYQNANTVNITGGQISSIGIVNVNIGGNANYQGTGFSFYSYQNNTPVIVTGGITNWAMFINPPNTTSSSNGLLITSGVAKADSSLMTRNADATRYGLIVRGDQAVLCGIGLVIPVGQSAYVPA